MYSTLLPLHNVVRWVFLAAAVYAIIKAVRGMSANTPYGKSDKTAATILLSSAHTQLLLGIVLWFLSPHVQQGLADMGAAMKDKAMRFQVIEHPLTMIIGVALIQIGKIRAGKAYADADKHKRSLIFYGLGLLLILSRIPWNAPAFRMD